MLYFVDLQIDNRKIYQDTEDYGFSQDSVLLASKAQISKSDKVLDLGTGVGILCFLIAIKKGAQEIVGVDIQEESIKIANKSLELNQLENQIKFINADVHDFEKYAKISYFDKVVCNPPYYNQALPKDANMRKAISSHESTATLDDFIYAATKALKNGGKLYMVHKMERLADVMYSLKGHHLEPKKIVFIKPFINQPADTFIVEAKKGAQGGLKVEEIVCRNDDKSYTEEFLELYK